MNIRKMNTAKTMTKNKQWTRKKKQWATTTEINEQEKGIGQATTTKNYEHGTKTKSKNANKTKQKTMGNSTKTMNKKIKQWPIRNTDQGTQ